ncbi:Ubiquitin-like-conjugating enzyme ATG10 [Lamellibrachia satsuma]|nr:Ubiquitin-like-conjugating enzyme ATG10 [Lamellibrachia satsuma]
MAAGSISYEDFKKAASYFIELSDRLCDSWQIQGTTDIYLSKKTKATLFATDATEPETQAQQLRLAQTESLGTQAVSEPQQSLSTVHSAESEDTKLVGTESAKIEFDEDERTLSGHQHKAAAVCTFDYHIVYSHSYTVPVLYFNVYTSDGALLPLDVLWTSIPVYYRQSLDRWTTLTQQEHPHLGRPFFQLHPCHTGQLMGKALTDCHTHLRRYLVCWLSSVGPLVHMTLPLGYSTS